MSKIEKEGGKKKKSKKDNLEKKQEKRSEAAFPAKSELIYAVRLVAEGRMLTETPEGIEEALRVLRQERAARKQNPEATLKKKREYSRGMMYAVRREVQGRSNMSEYVGSVEEGASTDWSAVQMVFHFLSNIDEAIYTINTSRKLDKQKPTLLGEDDSDFDDFAIEPMPRT